MSVKAVQMNSAAVRAQRSNSSESTKGEFSRIFKQAIEKEGLTFSKHAQERIVSRDIRLTDRDVSKIAEAVSSLDRKGGKTSLVLFGNTTFVTNVRERTIITALDKARGDRTIFTQIDSAVLVEKE